MFVSPTDILFLGNFVKGIHRMSDNLNSGVLLLLDER